ncbi:hypothetical protein [Paenibacillus sp. UNC499MF]|uniref:hypothetical protein n=1 Tax=Paenibacillus sp. UNC499MF TaxID=1502751 RepID=UPI0008A04A30|nr:hypothetical protein [Paenibacillus sp. UNC499MF]SEF95910.1 hypothetical protein SAMN02799616_01579 [Paenibacillus sp. UNC499MF]
MPSDKVTDSASGGNRLLSWRYYALFLLLTGGLEITAFRLGRSFADELTGCLVMTGLLALSVLLAIFTFVFGLLTCLQNRQHLLIVPCALLTAGLYMALIRGEGM